MTTPVPAPAPAPVSDGRTLGIVGLILAIFFSLIGLIVSIVALNQSKKAGVSNGPAVAGIVIGIIGLVVGLIVAITTIAGIVSLASTCAELGPGIHTDGPVTITCG